MRLIGVAAVTAVLVAAGPVVARSVVDFARNAHRVDGIHAVEASTSAGKRAGKLVATNANGRLPRNLIPLAADSSRLDGFSSQAFVFRCGAGSLRGHATVPSNVGAAYEEVDGFGTVLGGPLDSSGSNCHGQTAMARRVGPGTYRVVGGAIAWNCPEPPPDDILSAIVTPIGSGGSPLVASYRPVCDEGRVVAEVQVTDIDGAPTDAAFVIAFLDENGFPIP